MDKNEKRKLAKQYFSGIYYKDGNNALDDENVELIVDAMVAYGDSYKYSYVALPIDIKDLEPIPSIKMDEYFDGLKELLKELGLKESEKDYKFCIEE